jgi:hypothetical protein
LNPGQEPLFREGIHCREKAEKADKKWEKLPRVRKLVAASTKDTSNVVEVESDFDSDGREGKPENIEGAKDFMYQN